MKLENLEDKKNHETLLPWNLRLTRNIKCCLRILDPKQRNNTVAPIFPNYLAVNKFPPHPIEHNFLQLSIDSRRFPTP